MSFNQDGSRRKVHSTYQPERDQAILTALQRTGTFHGAAQEVGLSVARVQQRLYAYLRREYERRYGNGEREDRRIWREEQLRRLRHGEELS